MQNKVLLIILDGWGFSTKKEGNAILLANPENFFNLWKNYPHGLLLAHGEAVGLPKGQMGNSEVGHMNIGAGRIVYQDIVRITKAFEKGELQKHPLLKKAFELAKNHKLHLIGLLSDGGVHSHIEHLKFLLKAAKDFGLKKVYIHAILDGRDTPPKSAEKYLKDIEDTIKKLNLGKIATISGRYYAMDRDKRWDRTKLAYDAMVLGKGYKANSALEGLKEAYNREETDEFVKPTIINKEGLIEDGDVLIFYNFRADRMRQLVSAFGLKDFSSFEREKKVKPAYILTMTTYDETFPFDVLVPPKEIKNILGEIVSKSRKKQFRLAETEKYAHVTYFLNCGREEPFENEERKLIPSPKVATYDKCPEMSADKVKDSLLEALDKDYTLIVTNFANPDMVGHTGNLEATIKAIKVLDKILKEVVEKAQDKGFDIIITADHGNAEKMLDDKTKQPHTAHTTNPVPFILISQKVKNLIPRKIKDLDLPESFEGEKILGVLGNIAPTILKLLNLEVPKDMLEPLI